MGLFGFGKKDAVSQSIEVYENNKKEFLSMVSVAKEKNPRFSLELIKMENTEQVAKFYVLVHDGCVRTGDFIDIPLRVDNKLGIGEVTGQIKTIYQVHGSGSSESLVAVDEAYDKDKVWIDVPGVDTTLMYKTGRFTKSYKTNVEGGQSDGSSMSVSYDAEVSEMINKFKTELYSYFVENQTIGHITQDLSHSLLMQRKRMAKYGITMAIARADAANAAAINMDVNRYVSSQFDVAEAHEAIKLNRTYTCAGVPVYKDEDWRVCHYILAGAQFNNDGKISCPNCGNYAPREELLNGCPYCGTQFTIKDLSLRVAGYSQEKIQQNENEARHGIVDIGNALYQSSNHKEHDIILKHRMKDIDPLFSATAFYNSMRNKMYSVIFAEDNNSLQNLADCDFDVSPFHEKYKDVIDLDIQKIETKNVQKSDAYVLVDVIMTVMLLRFNAADNTARWCTEKITMTFVKNKDSKTKNIFEPSVVSCDACGSPFSLYSGKACVYCGKEIEYLMYDWMLVDMASEVIQ